MTGWQVLRNCQPPFDHADFRFGSDSDLDSRNREVRFTPVNRHRQFDPSGPKSAIPDLGGCVRDVGKYSHDYSDGPASYNRNRWHLQLCAP